VDREVRRDGEKAEDILDGTFFDCFAEFMGTYAKVEGDDLSAVKVLKLIEEATGKEL